MYGYICPWCGDHLDPSEKCNCREEKKKAEDMIENLMETEEDGQMILKEAIT